VSLTFPKKKRTKEKTLTTTRGARTYSVSLCYALFSLHRDDVVVDVALRRKCDEKIPTKKRTTPYPLFLLQYNFRDHNWTFPRTIIINARQKKLGLVGILQRPNNKDIVVVEKKNGKDEQNRK